MVKKYKMICDKLKINYKSEMFLCVGLLFLSLIILWNEESYKKEITLYSIISFAILICIYAIYKSSIANIFELLFTNGILFSFIFVAPETISSSYTKAGKVLYGISVGIITFGLYLINPALAVLGAILISSILSFIYDVKFELLNDDNIDKIFIELYQKVNFFNFLLQKRPICCKIYGKGSFLIL